MPDLPIPLSEIPKMDAHLVIAVASYADDLRVPGSEVYNQVAWMKKDLSKPVLIVWVKNIKDEAGYTDRILIRESLRGFAKVLEMEWDPAAEFDADKLRDLMGGNTRV